MRTLKTNLAGNRNRNASIARYDTKNCMGRGSTLCKASPTLCKQCCVEKDNGCLVKCHKFKGQEVKIIQVEEGKLKSIIRRLGEVEMWKKGHIRLVAMMEEMSRKMTALESKRTEMDGRAARGIVREKKWEKNWEELSGEIKTMKMINRANNKTPSMNQRSEEATEGKKKSGEENIETTRRQIKEELEKGSKMEIKVEGEWWESEIMRITKERYIIRKP